jgi:pSer/pThr/pTyr-binding forkhead associated (FHA) protein
MSSRNEPDSDVLPEGDEIATLPTRARLMAAAAQPVPTADDLHSHPKTLHVASMRVLTPKPPEARVPETSAAPQLSPDRILPTPDLPADEPCEPTRNVAHRAAIASTPKPQPLLRVLRGLRIDAEYPIYEGQNLIGRRDDKPVDVDLMDQEPVDRVWTSRHHAVITLENGLLTIEDLHSLNGTFVNRHQLFPGRRRTLSANDILQIGTIQLRVTF